MLLCLHDTNFALTFLASAAPLLRFRQYLNEETSQVPTAGPLSRLQQSQCAAIEDVDSRVPVGRLDVTGSNYSQLLVCLIIIAL